MIAVSNPKLATNTAYAGEGVSDSVLERGDRKPFTPTAKRVYLKPDDDLRNAITIDELRKEAHLFIDKLFDKHESGSIASRS